MKSVISYLQQHFAVQKLGDITWGHAVNSQERLRHALNNPDIMMLEVDVRLSSQGEVVLAHPPAVDSDLSFAEFVRRVATSKQGIKLDMKDAEVLLPCLSMLREGNLQQPVLLNAGLAQGSSGHPTNYSAAGFLGAWRKFYPQAILSPDWSGHPYGQEHIDAMLDLLTGIENVTFPVQASRLPDSWAQVSQLLQRESYSLTIWDGQPVTKELLQWLQEHTDPERVSYDCFDEHQQRLKWW